MSRNIFILGAGASVESGAPLMNNFLDIAETLLHSNKLKEDDKHWFNLVLKYRAKLQSSHSKSRAIDIYNMEDVFSAFEMKKTLGRFDEESEDVTKAYRRVIARTLEESIKFSYATNRLKPTRSYQSFASLIKKIHEPEKEMPTVISFNYDIALDYALNFEGVGIDYCLRETSCGNSNALKLIKLHGSINWAVSSENGKISPIMPSDYVNKLQFFPDHREIYLPVSRDLKIFDPNSKEEPFIVPPTWNKTEYNKQLGIIWKNAAQELSEAENIYVLGYSLPDSDMFFRYLFSLGTLSDVIIKRMWVYNPDKNLEDRYRKLIGTGVLPRFKYFAIPFSEAISSLNNSLAKN